MSTNLSAIALPRREYDIAEYPILSNLLFSTNKRSYFGKVFYCPECKEYYCFGYNTTDAYCSKCSIIKFFKDACLKRSSARLLPHEKLPVPIKKKCLNCWRAEMFPEKVRRKEVGGKSNIVSFDKKRKEKKKKRKKIPPRLRRKMRKRAKFLRQKKKILTLLLNLQLEPKEVKTLEKMAKKAQRRNTRLGKNKSQIRSFQSIFPPPQCAY